MGTRSRIALATPNGAVYSTYCHWDGYPEGVGQTLLDHYQDEEKIRALVDLGYASSLKDTVEQTAAKAVHKDEEPATHDTVEDFYAAAVDGWEEYVYLWKDGRWLVSEVGGGAGPMLVSARDPDGALPANWKELTDVLSAEPADA